MLTQPLSLLRTEKDSCLIADQYAPRVNFQIKHLTFFLGYFSFNGMSLIRFAKHKVKSFHELSSASRPADMRRRTLDVLAQSRATSQLGLDEKGGR